MKKLLSIIFALTLLVLCFAACDKNREDKDSESVTDTETVTDAFITTEAETQPVISLPDYTNPLTGLGTKEDLSSDRPVAIMINNLWGALPQEGIADCDIMYECLVEGGITRLMAVTADYKNLGVIGSIRSSRHYYLDLAKNYDAIYIHAGGSNQAYLEIKNRGVNNLDGVNMYVPGMFYRDEKRLETMKLEHTMMTSGEKIAAGIAFKKYRTELSEDFKNKDAFRFTVYGESRVLDGDTASCVLLPYSKYQTARFDYNADTNSYYRYQFEDVPHIDGTTGEQISYTNLLILFCKTVAVGDAAGHLDITTESTLGEGYYVYGGRYEPITWSKPTEDSPTTYYSESGDELVFNRGKTFISIFPEYNAKNIDFNYVIPAVEE
ncbi:MAG: DUF3048 domain-containing protein [Clostridia bacterium]|nr:DUF3048 domain-containing protein [Clostridia bacterium]